MKKQQIENKIFASIISYCEEMEANEIYRGNGHHLAQRLTQMVSIGILPKQQRKIYNALTKEPQSTKEIAEKVGMTTRLVSSQLRQMSNGTQLIFSKTKNERRKLWYR